MSEPSNPVRPSPSEWLLYLLLVEADRPMLLSHLLARLPPEGRPTARAGRKQLDRLCAKGWARRVAADRRRPSGHLLYEAAQPLSAAVEAEWEHLLHDRLPDRPEALEALRALVQSWLHEHPLPYGDVTESQQAAADTVHEKPDQT